MKNSIGVQEGLKFIFSLISLLLMIPSLVNGDVNYYRTLFIFLINRVMDLFYKKKNVNGKFFAIWALFNQWLGALAVAFAFCSILEEFRLIFSTYANCINKSLFGLAVSFVLRDLLILVTDSIKEELVIETIRDEVKGLKGENK